MNTRAVATLVEIMQDKDISIRIRIEACEGLLEYEAPQDVVELAKVFLTEVFEDRELGVGDRLDATKLMRKFEAPKVTSPTVRAHVVEGERDRTEAWREHTIYRRKMDLVAAGVGWPLPPGWDDDLRSPDWLPPPGWPPSPDMRGLAERCQETILKAKAERLRLVVSNPAKSS
jgi:hypothetical protein